MTPARSGKRASNANDEAWIRMLWELWKLSPEGLKANVGDREPNPAERKRIVRQLRNLGTRKREYQSTAGRGYDDAMRFIDTLTYNAGKDLSHLEKYPPEDRYRRMPKPWKGKAGRDKHAENANADDLARRAKQLHSDEPALTYVQIAERLGLEGEPDTLQKRISRYLKRP